ncbi:membrane protein insertase YidC [Hyphomicrobiales bacterium]|nr:membrane protein insertase YidC [Hyphomicrobiales bacterium]MDA9904313.1 membrane protein insertase YidC [Hyphomicrobiales bacterium]
MNDTSRYIVAIVLAMIILFSWQILFPVEDQIIPTNIVESSPKFSVKENDKNNFTDVVNKDICSPNPIIIENESLEGSIDLCGAKINEIFLKKFNTTTDQDSDYVQLFNESSYWVNAGWLAPRGANFLLPSENSLWKLESQNSILSPNNPVVISWDNGEDLKFIQTYSVDEDYLFSFKQEVENNSLGLITLFPFSKLSRQELPTDQALGLLHEGPTGWFDEELEEQDYDDIEKNEFRREFSSGWIGIRDKYWATAISSLDEGAKKAHFKMSKSNDESIYRIGYTGEAISASPGSRLSSSGLIFIGAKEVDIIDNYSNNKDLPNFDLLIDWGWFYFISKPLFYILDFLFSYTGNFGIAILLLTVLIKLVFFPVVNRSYVQMAKMRKVQPEIAKMKELYGDDRQRMAQEMQSLYKKEELKPLSGCLPVFIQIPVFFALYNVLLVTIEMRHAPFIGWIRDLSAPDPLSVFNLFGIINWTPPQILMIGVFHLLFGLTFLLQTKLNPAPTDPIQKTLFTWMPIFMIFIAANFPIGLVIYWAWNGLLSIMQQAYIMKKQGMDIALFENFRKKENPND